MAKKKNYENEDGVWRTVGGRRIFIRTGQPLSEAMKLSKKFNKKNDEEELEDKIIDVVNNGQVFDFSVGPTMTICSRYENGEFSYYYSSGDSPMSFFEREIVPYLKDEFVVVDDDISKIPRTSRFKKYGYEVVGQIDEREKDISTGKFVKNKKGYVWKKWTLMQKKGND